MTFNTGWHDSQKSLCTDKNMIQYRMSKSALGSKAALHIQNIRGEKITKVNLGLSVCTYKSCAFGGLQVKKKIFN